jgi:catechol 2,3-dioxygenase-like lactoylglutathione lyase family enzyme
MSQRAFHDTEWSTEVAAKDNEHLMLKSNCRNMGVHHVGLHANDPAASAVFYSDILGMEVVGESGPEHPIGATAFLSSRPDEESHEIALFADATLVHTAFKVSSLAEFRLPHAQGEAYTTASQTPGQGNTNPQEAL